MIRTTSITLLLLVLCGGEGSAAQTVPACEPADVVLPNSRSADLDGPIVPDGSGVTGTPGVPEPVPGTPGTSDADADGDGVSEACEFALAVHFAPTLMMSAGPCNWDQALEQPRGGFLFGARSISGSEAVRVVYLPAYMEDCGWSGAKCVLRIRGGCDGHPGDSEFIALDVTRTEDGIWEAQRVFLSAHCFGSSGGRCRWYDASDLEWDGSSPIVWVAEGKNANYPSRSSCGSGHWFYDTCERNDRRFLYPVDEKSANIGSARTPFPESRRADGCVGPVHPSLRTVDAVGEECIWEPDPFRGWHGRGAASGATSYRRYLEEFGGFERPSPAEQPGA